MNLHYQDIAAIVVLLFFSTTVRGTDVQFSLDTSYYHLSEGHIRLDWTAVEGGEYELQQAGDITFAHTKTLYKGPDNASFISGLKNGKYYYRVRAANQQWSEVLTIEVEHQSLQLALTLFSIGGVVFILTVIVVVRGSMQTKNNTA